jgi:hypothetical protein
MVAAHRDTTADGASQLELQEPDRLLEGGKMTAEDIFAVHLSQHRTIVFERQYYFAKSIGRRWRFDFAFPRYKVAVEINGVCVRRLAGQLVVMGRHASIEGIRGDYEKLNHAALMGWHVLSFLQSDVKPRDAITMTLRVLASRGWRAYK